MDFGYVVGFIGIGLGVCVPIPQLLKIKRTGVIDGISVKTYIFLCFALASYLVHAIYIDSLVFTVAQSVNLATNSVILGLLVRKRR